MLISAVLAVSENDVLGSENTLPWRLSNDLKRFKKNTLGKPMIMGRKTFDSLPGVLPGRTTIILTRDKTYKRDGALIAHTIEEALDLAKKDAADRDVQEISIVGGGEIYRLFLSHIQRFYLTRVHTEIEGDTYFFPLPKTQWKTESSEFHEKSEKNEYDHTFFILDRI
ncbi:MAG: dihydrofolate reductase [Sneathiella sp.]|nr:dihydrofolate reductase [Sneathiella sp.]